MDQLSYLPRVERENLKVWDDKRNSCCGYLNKRAGSSSTLSKGKWQKRWFVIKLQINAQENYSISYYHAPDEKSARQTFTLDTASISVGSGNNIGNSFQLVCKDGTNIMLGADSKIQMDAWLETLDHVIEVATARGAIQRERWGAKEHSNKHLPELPALASLSAAPHHTGNKGSITSPPKGVVGTNSNPFHVQVATCPTVRLDVDINTMPPGSPQRNQFEELFINDICRTIDIDLEMVRIHRIYPAPGMDWLTLVEFDIYVSPESIGIDSNQYDNDEDEKRDYEIQSQCKEKRREILSILYQNIKDPSSSLYNGFVTCSLDPSFSETLLSELSEEAHVQICSSDPAVLEIMEKYQSVRLNDNEPDVSHFTIYLSFEGRVRPALIPNPLILKKQCCVLWPYEVKAAIGMMGNMQELWIEPMALTPLGLPKKYSDPIFFEPSARLGGTLVINASRLKADLTYEVMCDDRRTDILQQLSDETKAEIRETFEQYDVNGDGKVSRYELEELVKTRTAKRKEIIDQKFAEVVSEAKSDEEYFKAEEFRRMHYQQLTEAQVKLVKMFENADIDGNGTLSFTEFLLAEAWWQLCTLNPDRASLF